MQKTILLFSAFLALVVGCKTENTQTQEPVVSPTVITNEVQSVDDPVLPPYTPWWAEGGAK